jgi:transcriptional regulator with XRE-family HTH domain
MFFGSLLAPGRKPLKLPRLRKVREQRGWSQGVLAEKADVSRDSISNYETGQRDAYPATARKLADALGVSVAELEEKPIALALDAAEKQAIADRQTIARTAASGRPQVSTVQYENEALRRLLEHEHGDVAEALVELARRCAQLEQKNARLEQKNARLQEERGRETAMRQELEIRPE